MRLIQGVGINDSNEPTMKTLEVNGKSQVIWRCPIYVLWSCMLQRCYSGRYPSYEGFSVCDEWLKFSAFKAWVLTQDWEGRELDKDLLGPEEKVYSPTTCCFLPKALNVFLVDRRKERDLPEGVVFKAGRVRPYAAETKAGKRRVYLGYYATADEAHNAWRKFKHEKACQWADMMIDSRLSDALRRRYLNEEEENE